MGLRIFTEPQQGASYDQLLAVARTTEECGFEGFFRSDHFLKMGSGTGMPAYTDAWTTLAGLARDTRSIRLGTLVTPATFRTVGTFPAVVTEVDHMSQGRVEVGLGAGWYQDEHVAYGIPFPGIGARYDLLEDQLAILHGVWTAPPGSLFERDGLTCNVRIQADPFRPAQKPHPPIILGGGFPHAAKRAIAYGDGWIPIGGRQIDPLEVLPQFRKMAQEAGRDPASLSFTVFAAPRDPELLKRYRDAGVDRVVLPLPPQPRDKILPMLDESAALMRGL